MKRNILFIVLGLVVIVLILLVGVLYLLQPKGNVVIITNKNNIVEYRVLDRDTVLLQTTDNSIYKTTANNSQLIFQYNPQDKISISPLGNYYAQQNDKNITIFSTTDNQPIAKFNANLFSWQKDDAYIFAQLPPKTNNPLLAVDYDIVVNSTIFYVELPGKPLQPLTQKSINSLLYYSNNPKVLYYLTPNTKGNELQESILVKDPLTSPSTNLSTYSNYSIKVFNDGVVINDSIVGNSIISDGTQFSNNNFTVQSGLQKINNKLSTLTLEKKNDNWYINITGVENGKTKSNILPLPKEFNGQNLRNPTLYKSLLFFQSDSGIFNTDLGDSYAQ